MTQRERQILNWIEENPLISQQELAEKAGITRSSVAVHISNLMKKGYITGKGYIVHTAPYVTVVGGVNMDIGGWPSEVPVDRDSNPGAVRMSLGGVGRNIAHNMSLLGLDVRMVTAFGDDLYAQKIAASCGELGIDISQSPVIPEGHTSTYLFINDEKGDMLLAVSDMDIYRHLTPQLLSQRQKLLSNSGGMDQRAIDQLLQSQDGEEAAPQLSKGLNGATLRLIQDFLARSQGQALTSEEIAEQVHLSRITIRRYVNYMVETGELVSSIDYQTGGRPSIRYRYTGSFGAAGKGST